MLPITRYYMRYNKTSAVGRAIQYIVIHDTGNTGYGAGVDAHFNFFNGGNRDASADFFVDGGKIGQFTDYRNEYAWHCGDGGGAYGITNRNSVGIEICVNRDGDYAKAVANAVDLVKYLMKELNIPIERVVRHYDASRKPCPNSMMANGWANWYEFKKAVAYVPPTVKPFEIGTYGGKVQITASALNVRSGRGSEHPIIGVIYNGDVYTVNYILPDNRDGVGNNELWGSIDYKGKTGFIHLGYAKPI